MYAQTIVNPASLETTLLQLCTTQLQGGKTKKNLFVHKRYPDNYAPSCRWSGAPSGTVFEVWPILRIWFTYTLPPPKKLVVPTRWDERISSRSKPHQQKIRWFLRAVTGFWARVAIGKPQKINWQEQNHRPLMPCLGPNPDPPAMPRSFLPCPTFTQSKQLSRSALIHRLKKLGNLVTSRSAEIWPWSTSPPQKHKPPINPPTAPQWPIRARLSKSGRGAKKTQ